MKSSLKIILTCLGLLTISYSAHCQDKVEIPVFRYESNKNLKWFLSKHISEEASKQHLFHECINSATFVKFTLNEEGNIDQISFSKGSSPKVNAVLEPVIRSMEGYWTPKKVNGIAVKSDPFILPYIYNFEVGCSYSNYLERYQKDVAALMQAVGNILQFEDGSSTENLACIMLAPVRGFSVE